MGLHDNTVQEALNKHLGKIIRVTPLVTASSAYADGDVLFEGTEIPNAVAVKGGTSRLVNAYIVDEDSQTVSTFLVFTENDTDFGTMHATANISYDNAVASKINCVAKFDENAQSSDFDNFKFKEMQSMSGTNEGNHPLLLQAASDSTSVYVQGIIFSGTPTFTQTDSLHLIFHVEYR